jgi:DNA polymerase
MSTRFNVCDLNAIETRVGAWLAGCTDLMNVFVPYTDQFGVYQPNGRDPYLSFACKMYCCEYAPLYADYKGKNGKERKGDSKRKRQIAKPGVLGAIYRLSGGGWGKSPTAYKNHGDDCNAGDTYTEQNGKVKKVGMKYCRCEEVRDRIKTGLWGYADNMGIEMPQEQAHEVVRIFRESYPEICDPQRGIWKQLEVAVADVMHPDHPATVRTIGPNDCVLIDRMNIEGRHPMMRMRLPSGRYLHYLDARMEPTLMPWKGEDDDGNEIDVFRDSLIYAGTNQKTKQWDIWVSTHGGKLFENLVQGIARDILGASLLKFEEREMPVIGHVHDEGICLVEDDLLSPTYHDMVEIMSTPISWAPGLLLGADGFEETYYHK